MTADDGAGRTAVAAGDGAWAAAVAAMADLPALLTDVPAAETAAGRRYLLRFLAAGIRVCIEADDTHAPMLTRSIEHGMTWGLDNPDTTYLYSRLDPAGTYRLRGSRGSARHLEVQVNTGHQGDGDFAGWRATWWRTGDDLGDPIDVEIPPTRDASFLLIRQYFSDWDREVPATLDLQRLDRDLPPPPLDDGAMSSRLALLEQWLRVGAACWDNLSGGLRASTAANRTAWTIQPFLPPDEASGLKGQAYGMGAWHCAPDEAVVVTLRPPPATYWGVSLCDRFWQSIDFAQRQSSLNDTQAVPDADADTVTCVIAHHDPGVANWLDPGGRTSGTLAVRYLFPTGDALPAVELHRVAASELHLPAGVAAIDAEQRQVRLRARQAAVASRLRW